MRTLIPALAGAVLMIGMTAMPTIAQTHEVGFGLYGGASRFGDLTPADPTRTELDDGWIAGVQMERWLAQGRVGLRLNVGYADRALSTHNHDRFRLFSGDLSVLVRLLRPEPYRMIAPYIALGGGA